MENSSRLLKDLAQDVNQFATSIQSPLVDENDTDLIRRRRLEHLSNSKGSPPPSSADVQDNHNNNNV